MTDLLLVEKLTAVFEGKLGSAFHGDTGRMVAAELAAAAIATMEAHRPPVTVASPGYEAGLAEGARLMQEAAWKAAWTAEPLPEHPLHGNDLSAFQYGKDCAMVAIRALSPPSIADDGK